MPPFLSPAVVQEQAAADERMKKEKRYKRDDATFKLDQALKTSDWHFAPSVTAGNSFPVGAVTWTTSTNVPATYMNAATAASSGGQVTW